MSQLGKILTLLQYLLSTHHAKQIDFFKILDKYGKGWKRTNI